MARPELSIFGIVRSADLKNKENRLKYKSSPSLESANWLDNFRSIWTPSQQFSGVCCGGEWGLQSRLSINVWQVARFWRYAEPRIEH